MPIMPNIALLENGKIILNGLGILLRMEIETNYFNCSALISIF